MRVVMIVSGMCAAMALSAFAGAAIGLGGLGAIEGHYRPAAQPMTLTRIEDAGGGAALFWGASARLRPECSFAEFDWKLGRRGSQHVPVTVTPGPPVVRPDGAFTFGPWRVNITPEEFQASYGDVLHDCGWPWLTRSRFWN